GQGAPNSFTASVVIDAATRRLVRARAGNRCEYCRLPQSAIDAAFHVEHVVPRQHRGGDDESNLALACDRCNLMKGPNLTAVDPVTADVVRVFDPRREIWHEHFELQDATIVGLSPTGRATVELLQFNAPRRRHLRDLLIAAGMF